MMATLLSAQNGNFTGTTTNPWQLVDATSLSNSEAASTASTVSWVSSTTFSPGAITVDGIALKVSAHNSTGNIAIRLGKSGTITANTNTNPTVITSANHGLVSGEAILIAGSNSTPALAGPYTVTVITGNTFSVPVNVTVAGTAGTWTTVLSTITSNTNVAVPVFSTTVNHGLSVGTQITIKGSTATLVSGSFNGTWTIATVPSASSFTVTGAPSGVGGATGWAAYNIVGVSDTVVVAAAVDLPIVNTGSAVGWSFFKFPSSFTLTSGATYSAQIAGSTAGNWTPWRTATAADWSRALRTTTAQSPAAGDTTLICGQYSGVGTNSAWTVTMDSTSSATSYGAIEICGNGTLAYGTAASTAYYLKIAGSTGTTTTGIQGYAGGTFTIGTQASPIPSTSTAQLEFACTSAVQYGFDANQTGFTFSTGGNTLTYVSALLAADANSGATSLTTNVSTGWVSGTSIGVASTTQTRAQSEKVSLTANASSTTLTVSALANAHGGGGTANVVAEVINLTRNVQIFSTSTTNTTYLHFFNSNVNMQYAELYNLGSNTNLKRGVDVVNTLGTVTINGCSIHDCTPAGAIGINVTNGSNNNITVSSVVLYNITSTMLSTVITTATNNTYSNIIAMLGGAVCMSIGDIAGTVSNLTAISGTTAGITIASSSTGVAPGTVSGLIAHSNTGPGIQWSGSTTYGNNPYSYHSNITSWRNTTYGLVFSNTFGYIIDGTGNGNVFGNATAGMQIGGSCANVYLRNLIFNAGTTLLQPVGCAASNDCKDFYIDNTTFGATTTHSTGDVQAVSANTYFRLFLRNCLLDSATPVVTPINMIEGSEISLARYQQTAGNHKAYYKFGALTPDTTIYNYASPSVRLTPTTAGQKLRTGWKKVAVPNGATATISVWVRKSVAGDGTAYNGNQPRLIQRADAATGNNVDTVLATATNSANGAWMQLQATISAVNDNCAVTVYVDCDGTTGWVNVDDWLVN
jgi:hypothetical protein